VGGDRAAHARHELESLLPVLAAALAPRRPAPLLVAEGALSRELLALLVAGELCEEERQPAARRQLPSQLVRIGFALHAPAQTLRAVAQPAIGLHQVLVAGAADAPIVDAGFQRRHAEGTRCVCEDRRAALQPPARRRHHDADDRGAVGIVYAACEDAGFDRTPGGRRQQDQSDQGCADWYWFHHRPSSNRTKGPSVPWRPRSNSTATGWNSSSRMRPVVSRRTPFSSTATR